MKVRIFFTIFYNGFRLELIYLLRQASHLHSFHCAFITPTSSICLLHCFLVIAFFIYNIFYLVIAFFSRNNWCWFLTAFFFFLFFCAHFLCRCFWVFICSYVALLLFQRISFFSLCICCNSFLHLLVALLFQLV